MKVFVSIVSSWDLKHQKSFPPSRNLTFNCIQFISKFGATYNMDKKEEKGIWFKFAFSTIRKLLLFSETKRQKQKTKLLETQDTEVESIWILTINVGYLLTLYVLNGVNQEDRGRFVYNTYYSYRTLFMINHSTI